MNDDTAPTALDVLPFERTNERMWSGTAPPAGRGEGARETAIQQVSNNLPPASSTAAAASEAVG